MDGWWEKSQRGPRGMGGEKAGAPGQEKMRRCRWRLNARQAGGVRGSARWGGSARLTHAPAGAMPAVRVHCSAVFGCRKNHKPGQAPAQSASTQGITPGWTLAERSSHIPPAASAGGAAGLGRFRRRVLGDSGGAATGGVRGQLIQVPTSAVSAGRGTCRPDHVRANVPHRP